MLSKHPWIRCFIITEQRFFPIKKSGLFIPPCRMLIIFHGFRVLPNDFSDVFYLICSVVLPLVPCPVKHSHYFVFSLFACEVIICSFTSKGICKCPVITVDSFLTL